MLNIKIFGFKGLFRAGFSGACFLLLSVANVFGADYDGSSIEWKLDAGLEKERFDKLLEDRLKAGMPLSISSNIAQVELPSKPLFG